MLNTAELKSIAEARLNDAGALLSKGRYDGAIYLCGYAVEIALKARIVKTLNWTGFPESGEFDGLKSFQTHDLDILLHLSGWEAKIKAEFLGKWSNLVDRWDTESRYKPPSKVTESDANSMVENVTQIVGALF